MTPDTHAEAQPSLTDSAKLVLESAGVEIDGAETQPHQGPGPGDETVMTWARAM